MEETLQQLNDLLADEFEIDPASIRPDAHLFEDLDIDSIDAIDMLSRLRELTGKELPADELKSVRTVGPIVAGKARFYRGYRCRHYRAGPALCPYRIC